ncbi:MAG: hypothetical protein HY938_04295 [Nitrosomonadales bacterium]|nr:hypothetical protein [Nitrosomonadales bacterium]
MKNIILSLAGLLAATAFAPQASALPAFARQTGMECAACHQQHFPVLNTFGRSFKANGYTMMGSQAVVEGEHLSIPGTLNAAVLIKMRYQSQTNGGGSTRDGNGEVLANGDAATGSMLQMGNEFSLFFGGRVAENIGFLMENNVAAQAGPLIAGLRLPIMFDVAGAKVSAIPFSTDALGISYGYELSSAGVMRANRWAELRRDSSAIQYAIADGNGSHGKYAGAAAGLALVAQNDMGYINFSKWTPNAMPGGNDGGIASYSPESSYLRIAVTPNVAGWDMVGGVGMMSGSSELAGAGLPAATPAPDSALVKTEARFADLQAHGQVAGNDMGVYVTYAVAPNATAGGQPQLYNTGAFDKSAVAVGVDYSVIPHVLHVGGAYRAGKTGKASPTDATVSATDNAVMLQAIYDLTQNVALHVAGSSRNGTKYAAPGAVGAKEYILMLEAAW